ncbi:hypothetical protein TEA_022660 [Camellia sinensis var. sinensis]|uniref:Uncharacterized protein n=1 Tax=Camellia sinensis var. sinensis TaxID=542762 RepID=A0A4S4DNK4_CAMSN|nr:hypothetical protein TEA_022660 [Camellia sinensis var. sinensis]
MWTPLQKILKLQISKRFLVSLKDYEVLRERTVNGEPNLAQVQSNSGVDPDAVAAIRRQRLSEISLWFNPHNTNNPAIASLVVTEQPSNIVGEEVVPVENPATKWAVEGTGILLATGLLTVSLAWLIAPRVGKKTAKSGLHILLGGICALTVVVLLSLCKLLDINSFDLASIERICFSWTETFIAIHRRQLNGISIIQMQKFYSIADVVIKLRQVAENKVKNREECKDVKKRRVEKFHRR